MASEFSLDLQESLGGQTCANLDSIENEVSRLKDNCETMSEIVDFKAVSKNMKTSKSEYFSKESTPADLSSLSSSPDLRNLHKIIHTAPLQNKQLWTLTNLSDNDSNYSPMHRDISRYKITSLSSNTSECGEWEWDSEGLSAELTANPTGIYIQGKNQICNQRKCLSFHNKNNQLLPSLSFASKQSDKILSLQNMKTGCKTTEWN